MEQRRTKHWQRSGGVKGWRAAWYVLAKNNFACDHVPNIEQPWLRFGKKSFLREMAIYWKQQKQHIWHRGVAFGMFPRLPGPCRRIGTDTHLLRWGWGVLVGGFARSGWSTCRGRRRWRPPSLSEGCTRVCPRHSTQWTHAGPPTTCRFLRKWCWSGSARLL